MTISLADVVVTETRFSVLCKSNLLALAACLALASTIAGQSPPTAEAPHVLALRVTAADHRRDAAHDKSPAANPHVKISGALMRSEVVSGWPGLLVDGFDGVKKLKLLRMDRLSANVLLCMFEGDVTAVDWRLRPETAHFGLDQKEGDSSGFYKILRDQNGDESGQHIDTIPWRQTPPGTLDISALATAIKGNALTFTSAQFALQMIETSGKARFQLKGS